MALGFQCARFFATGRQSEKSKAILFGKMMRDTFRRRRKGRGRTGRDDWIRTSGPLLPNPLKGNQAKASKERISSILNELSDYAKFTKFPEFAHFVNLLVAFWSQISDNDFFDESHDPENER
jgi:hypothetical protein